MAELINSIDMKLLFNNNTVRIIGTTDNPLFVVKDICSILEISNVSQAVQILPEKWKTISKLDTTGGRQNILSVNEAGLYKIIMRSNKPIAQTFQEFVCEEILPSIRKTGEYKYQKILDEHKKLQMEKEKAEDDKKKIEIEKEKAEEELRKLKKKYVKEPKQIFDEKNVVYLITSVEGEQKREYVVGKSLDLSRRKDDYNQNKLHDFKVIYYKACKDSKFMDLIESVVLMKLDTYRCKAGRDVFELPESCDIKIFTDIFDECAKFFSDLDIAIYPKRTLVPEDKKSSQERHKKYYEKNKDQLKEKAREYNDDNKEQLKIIRKIYHEDNSEKVAAAHKKYYENNKQKIIGQATDYYNQNKEDILEDRKNFYNDNKQAILDERKKYYEQNYKTKVAVQRQKKETCECGMTVSHYCMKKHKLSKRHENLMEKLNIDK